MGCLATLEKLSRELIYLPVLMAILSRNGSQVHKGDYLVGFFDRDIQPMHFFYDFFQMSDNAENSRKHRHEVTGYTSPLTAL